MDHHHSDRIPGVSPFADPITPVGSVTPYGSQPNSDRGSTSALPSLMPGQQRYFHSRRVPKGSIEKPWLAKTDPKEKWVTIIPIIGMLIGVGLAGYLVYDGLSSVIVNNYCQVFQDTFQEATLDTKKWNYEVQSGGYHTGSFDVTTNSDDNTFIEGNVLFLQPTINNQSNLNQAGASVNLSDSSSSNINSYGKCTATIDIRENCFMYTNFTAGNYSVINPFKSSRINTMPNKDKTTGMSIRYGRVEVEAQLPEGDWLFPAISMLPVNETYGPWPYSGQIDIMASRGNDHTYPTGGNNIVSSALHWGPDAGSDAARVFNNKHRALHTTFSKGFNTFGLEWSEKYLFTYVNTRLLQVLYTTFKDNNMWARGDFPEAGAGGTKNNQSIYDGSPNAPFDQYFYLVMNVGVGSTNGWFLENIQNRPWVVDGPQRQAAYQLWNSTRSWEPYWGKQNHTHAMQVRSVKIWQQMNKGDTCASLPN